MEEIIKALKEIKEHQMQTVQLARSTEVYKLADKALTKALSLYDVSNSACLKPPHFKQKRMTEKAEKAKNLRSIGYSIREIMRIMNYKSPKSVQDLLKR